jgi:hypothetical protein
VARKQVPITEIAEKHLSKIAEKRKADKKPYGRTALVQEAILKLRG